MVVPSLLLVPRLALGQPDWHDRRSTRCAGDPAGYVLDADGTQHVVYRGTDNHIYELWWCPASCWSPGWHWGNLTGTTGAPLAAGDPAGYVLDADGTQHVVYRGNERQRSTMVVHR